MTLSPAFLPEIQDQAVRTRRDLDSALAIGDESGAQVASGRLADLDEISRRATDDTLLVTTSWA